MLKDNRRYAIIFIITLFIIYITFFTPHVLMNLIIAMGCRYVKLTYVIPLNDGSNRSYLEHFTFSHYSFDAKLMSLHLMKAQLTYDEIIDTPTLYHEYQIVKYYQIPTVSDKYTSFTHTCATICKDIFKNTNKKKLNISVVVGKRYLLKNKLQYGNYLCISSYTISKNNTYEEICKRHHNAVKKEMNSKNTYAKLISSYDYLKSDVVFNSQRDLTHISHENGSTMYKLNNLHFYNEQHMKSLLYDSSSSKFIDLNKYDDNWIITKISKAKNYLLV